MNAKQEESRLAKCRNVGLDVMATTHIMEAYNTKTEWTCNCFACQYMRATPRLVESVYKALKNQ